MADRKLSALTELATTPAAADEVYIRDVSELAADESKRITIANLIAYYVAHKTQHQDGGGDEISVTGLSGLLADDQHVLDAEVRAAAVSDAAYGAGWNGVTTIAPSKNAVYDKIETLGAATKEFYVPVTLAEGGIITSRQDHVVANLDTINDDALITFFVPNDFTSIIDAVIIVVPDVNEANAYWDTLSGYGAVGEGHRIHAETNTGSTYNVTFGDLFEVDISGILSSLVAGDYVGIRLTLKDSAHDVSVMGIRFKYS